MRFVDGCVLRGRSARGRPAAAARLPPAQVESVNIVGYQSVGLPDQQQIITGVAFQAVGGGLTDLQSVVLDGVDPDGTTRIWWWNKDTGTYSEAFWVELYDTNGGSLGVNGWGDFAYWIAIAKTFVAGEGFWVKAPNAGAQILFDNPLAP
jgi:hypothetical protein